MIPLKAVAPVRIRSGLPSSTSPTRPLTSRNEGQRPCCVSDHVRPGPAVGGYLCPIRARVPVSDGGLTAVPPCVPQLDRDRRRRSYVVSCNTSREAHAATGD